MIITNNEEALRVKCEEVLPEEVNDLVTILEKELAYANYLGKGGIGLAAPQIGIAKNIAIIRLGKTQGLDLNLVNCKLDKVYDPAIFKDEGCLSFPGRMETTSRFQEIHVINNLIYPHNFIATGFIAVVCQHELDHLNSVLFMDHKVPTPPVINKKVRPNDLCLCGSNSKYKKCCGKNI